jgi:hypothetical protein
VAVDALLELHLGEKIVDADLERLLDHAADLDRPRPDSSFCASR